MKPPIQPVVKGEQWVHINGDQVCGDGVPTAHSFLNGVKMAIFVYQVLSSRWDSIIALIWCRSFAINGGGITAKYLNFCHISIKSVFPAKAS